MATRTVVLTFHHGREKGELRRLPLPWRELHSNGFQLLTQDMTSILGLCPNGRGEWEEGMGGGGKRGRGMGGEGERREGGSNFGERWTVNNSPDSALQ